MSESKDSEDPQYDIEAYRQAIVDARRTLDQQLTAFNDIGEKAWRLVRLNGLIATVYVAAVANTFEDLAFTPITMTIIGFGGVFLGISTLLAMIGQREHSVPIGQSPDSLRSLRETDPTEIAYLYKTIESYEQWIDIVNKRTSSNARAVNWSKYVLLCGIMLIIAGTLLALVR